jgi:hypothetical protein
LSKFNLDRIPALQKDAANMERNSQMMELRKLVKKHRIVIRGDGDEQCDSFIHCFPHLELKHCWVDSEGLRQMEIWILGQKVDWSVLKEWKTEKGRQSIVDLIGEEEAIALKLIEVKQQADEVKLQVDDKDDSEDSDAENDEDEEDSD